MENDVTTEPGTTDPGQAADGTASQTTATAPAGNTGQSADGTTSPGTQDDTFFDPKELSPDLVPAYKKMQATWTKKMQAISADREKIAAYDAFMQNPLEQLRTIAEQQGYQLVQPGQQTQTDQQGAEPKTWDEVYQTAEQRAYERIKKEFTPFFNEVKKMRATTIEQQLDEIDPMWRSYEEDMMKNLAELPKLAHDPARLYKLSVPDSVLHNRATQEALKKLEAKTKSAAMSGGSSTTKQSAEDLTGSKPRSFAESVEAAKKELASKGIRPPS